MAKANPVVLSPQAPEIDPSAPVITYVGEGADKVAFTINPKAARYEVNANGIVMEYLK